MKFADLRARFTNVRKCGAGWTARCPAHDDKDASLTLNQGADGRSLVYCHKGCSLEAISAALGITVKDLFATNGNRPAAPVVVQYAIRDLDSQVVALHPRRIDPATGKKVGRPWWTQSDGTKGLNGIPVATLPLYRSETLRALGDDATVVVTEGEPKADRLGRIGINAVGSVTRAGAVPDTEVLEPLRRFAEVILWPDHDEVGRTHMARISKLLPADRVRWIDVDAVPGLEAEGADAADLTDDQVLVALGQIVTQPSITKTEAPTAPDFSEEELALLLVNERRAEMRYLGDLSEWYICVDGRWRSDAKRQVFNWARQLCREAASEAPSKLKRALASAKTRYNLTSLASDDQRSAALADDFDRDLGLLGAPGQTILRSEHGNE